MRIVVLSDTHGSLEAFERIYQAQCTADYFIFLGDGYEQARTMRARHPEIPLLAVTGNCDFRENDSDVKLLTLEDGRKVIYTHGHRFHVKYGIEELVDFAVGSGASVVLFGHTHEKLCRYLDGILYVNPGRAASYDGFRFATLDFKDDQIIANLAHIK